MGMFTALLFTTWKLRSYMLQATVSMLSSVLTAAVTCRMQQTTLNALQEPRRAWLQLLWTSGTEFPSTMSSYNYWH